MAITFAAAHVLIVGIVLMASGSAKLWGGATLQVAKQSALAILVPTARWRSGAWRALGSVELGAGLAALAGARWGLAYAAMLLTGATVFSAWARQAVPGRPCGCFGSLSVQPTSYRTILRSGALALGTIYAAAVGTTWTGSITSGSFWGFAVAETCLLAYPSPETKHARQRLIAVATAAINAQRCARARVSPDVALAHLLQSKAWHELRDYLVDQHPVEHWREGCWTFLSFPARQGDEPATAIFAITLGGESAACRGALVSEERREVHFAVA